MLLSLFLICGQANLDSQTLQNSDLIDLFYSLAGRSQVHSVAELLQ